MLRPPLVLPFLALACSAPPENVAPPRIDEVAAPEPTGEEPAAESVDPEAERRRFVALQILGQAEEQVRTSRHREAQELLLQVATTCGDDEVVRAELDRISRVHGLRSGLPHARAGAAMARERLHDEIAREGVRHALEEARHAIELERWDAAYDALAAARSFLRAAPVDGAIRAEWERLGARLPPR